MNDLLGKLMAKKGADDSIDPQYKDSKLAVLQALKDEMTKMMGGDIQGLKKVTVAAPDQHGLQEGLAKAQELMGKGVDVDDDSNPATEDDESADDHEHEADDDAGATDDSALSPDEDPAAPSGMPHAADDSLDAMSPEELKALLKQLMAAQVK